jgi:hypothetical protein
MTQPRFWVVARKRGGFGWLSMSSSQTATSLSGNLHHYTLISSAVPRRTIQTLNVSALQAVARSCFSIFEHLIEIKRRCLPNPMSSKMPPRNLQTTKMRSTLCHRPWTIDESDAQKEWEASLQQLELILTMVIVPYTGKYFGRKFAYWSE